MRRWNGWGDETFSYPLAADAAAFLRRDLMNTAPPTMIIPQIIVQVIVKDI